ncbi:HAD-IA family hydrolase [Microcoleus sp. FACHB-SPT15]|uniref:HAD-IA family hydrolase n=1 Tax=Microcoleus sp. FACHB-SPT15 TaxID=2692830 RepID=UPI0028C44DB7|nr:HAD-IA family hydrolase [Microcoleus sp. FACHB-SPT15]
MMSVKVIIFDFDGTLADTFDAVVRISNRLASEFGYKQAVPDDLAKIRNLGSREIIKQSGISLFKIPFLLKRLKADLHNEILYLNPIFGIEEALAKLNYEGNQLGILTSNSEENVRIFLKKHEMEDLFSFIFSETKLFSKHKVLRKFLQKNHLTPEEVIYVGDETRDIEAAKKINMKAIAVSWGFNSKEALAAQNPEFLIHQPNELIDVIGMLHSAYASDYLGGETALRKADEG